MPMICNMHSLAFYFRFLSPLFALITSRLEYEPCFEVIYVQYIMNGCLNIVLMLECLLT
jgi:hypothetical protein